MNDALTQIQPYIEQLKRVLQNIWNVLQPWIAQGLPWLQLYPWQSLMGVIGALTILGLLFVVCANWLLRFVIVISFGITSVAGLYTLLLIADLFLAAPK